MASHKITSSLKNLQKTMSENLPRTKQSALFQSSPAMIYYGSGEETTLDSAFVFNDEGKEYIIPERSEGIRGH